MNDLASIKLPQKKRILIKQTSKQTSSSLLPVKREVTVQCCSKRRENEREKR